jgi:hypothetical protein
MDLAAVQPYWVLGLFLPERLPLMACNDLLHGQHGNALLELASLSRPGRYEVEPLFDQALEEIGVPQQSVDEAWRFVVRDILSRVAGETITLREAGRQLGGLAAVFADYSEADYPEPLLLFQAVDEYLDLGLLSDEQWEVALAQEVAELRDRLEGWQPVHRYGEMGLGAVYWLRRYGTLQT